MSALAMPGIAAMVGGDGFVEALRRRVPHVLLLGLTLGVMDALRAFPILLDTGDWRLGLVELLTVVAQSIASTAMMITSITYAECTPLAATHRVQAMFVGVVLMAPAATAVGTGLSFLSAQAAGTPAARHDPASLYLYLLWYALVTGLLAATYYALWDRARSSASRLAAVELERHGIEHRMVESRLNVMKARVDPEFLFRMIGDVQRLYRSDAEAAEQRLEDLIEYLRAALPQMRSGATTLGEEVRLVETFVRLHEEGFEGRLAAEFDVDEALAMAQFPPMALLPLVDDTLRRALQEARPRLVLRVVARGTPQRLSVAVEDDCVRMRHAIAGEPALECHERAFLQFFGEGARIRRGALAASGTRVLLEVDHDVAARTAG